VKGVGCRMALEKDFYFSGEGTSNFGPYGKMRISWSNVRRMVWRFWSLKMGGKTFRKVNHQGTSNFGPYGNY